MSPPYLSSRARGQVHFLKPVRLPPNQTTTPNFPVADNQTSEQAAGDVSFALEEQLERWYVLRARPWTEVLRRQAQGLYPELGWWYQWLQSISPPSHPSRL